MSDLFTLRSTCLKLVSDGLATQAQLAKEAGIDPGQLNRFLKSNANKGLSDEARKKLTQAVERLTPKDRILPPEHVQTLTRKLRETPSQLAIFIGSGLSYLARNPDDQAARLPMWGGLIDAVKQRFQIEDIGGLDVFDLAIANDSRGDLETAVRDILNSDSFQPSPAHYELQKLPWSHVITTNFDYLLCTVYNVRAPIHEEADFDRLNSDPQPLLIHIHGTLHHPHTLTAEDYRNWEDKHPRATSFFESVLENKTLLFVGFSLNDPHLNAILERVRKWRGTNREKRMFAWMYRVNEGQRKLLDSRDKITAIPIQNEEDFARAFRELQAALNDLPPPDAPPTPRTDADAYERHQYLSAVSTTYGGANLRSFYLPGAGYGQNDISLDDVFVMPSVHPLNFLKLEPAANALKRQPKVFLVGEPGQGKSTLLHHTLIHAAQAWQAQPTRHPFPVYVRLSELDTPAHQDDLLPYVRGNIPRTAEVSTQTAENWLNTRVLWLLDGLGEIRDQRNRERLINNVKARASAHPEDRWVITTRPGPAAQLHPGGDWAGLELAPLTDQELNTLLENWGKVLKTREPDVPYNPKELSKALLNEPGLRRLRRNSLLVTLAVLFYRTNRRLPRDRFEFYTYADRTLTDVLVRHRLYDPNHQPGRYLEELLNTLALTAMKQGSVAVSQRQLEAVAEPILRKYYSGQEIDQEMRRLTAAADDLIGALVAKGLDTYGFLHLTFQEFYAARALLNLSDEAHPIMARYWDHPDWREVWELYVLGADRQGLREEFFSRVRINRHEWDDELFRPELAILRWAGLERFPTDDLGETWRSVMGWAEQPTNLALAAAVFENWHKPLPPNTRSIFLMALKDKNEDVRFRAANALSSVASEPTVQLALLNALNDLTWAVPFSAANALSGVASEPTVQHALLNALNDQDEDVRIGAAQALSSVASEPTVQHALLNALNDQDEEVSFRAAWALSSVASEPTVQLALLNALNDQNEVVRHRAVWALSSVASEPTVQLALLNALNDQDEDVRFKAANALSSVASEPTVQLALLNALNDQDRGLRFSAAEALSSVASEPTVQYALLDTLDDEDEDVRSSAAEALSSVASEPTVQLALLNALNDQDGAVRIGAAQALSSVASEPTVQHALLNALNDQDEGLRFSAAEALSSVASEPTVQLALLNALNDQDEVVRHRAVWALSSVASEPTVQLALLNALNDQDKDVRRSAAESLSSVASEPTVQLALLNALNDQDGAVRRMAAWALREQIRQTAVQKAFKDFLTDLRRIISPVVYLIRTPV